MNLTKYDKIITANWKMNGSLAVIDEFHEYFSQNYHINNLVNNMLIICPPFPYLQSSKSKFSKFHNLFIGSQDCSPINNLSISGDVSSDMINDIECDFVILGHSERRILYNENNEIISKKIHNAFKKKLNVIACIGESENERNNSKTYDIIKDQINNTLINDCNISNTIIAYEPIWAIGTGIKPEIKEIEKMMKYIHEILNKKYNLSHNKRFKLLYGGSVNPDNSKEILKSNLIDGVLVGGASLSPDKLIKIINYNN